MCSLCVERVLFGGPRIGLSSGLCGSATSLTMNGVILVLDVTLPQEEEFKYLRM